jgi:hypothetical protein
LLTIVSDLKKGSWGNKMRDFIFKCNLISPFFVA